MKKSIRNNPQKIPNHLTSVGVRYFYYRNLRKASNLLHAYECRHPSAPGLAGVALKKSGVNTFSGNTTSPKRIFSGFQNDSAKNDIVSLLFTRSIVCRFVYVWVMIRVAHGLKFVTAARPGPARKSPHKYSRAKYFWLKQCQSNIYLLLIKISQVLLDERQLTYLGERSDLLAAIIIPMRSCPARPARNSGHARVFWYIRVICILI